MWASGRILWLRLRQLQWQPTPGAIDHPERASYRGPAMPISLAVLLGWTWLGALGSAQQTPPGLDTLLERASAYLAEYEKTLSSVVAEERYEQIVQYYLSSAAGGRIASFNTWTRRRKLVSDYLLVKVQGLTGWQPFRDVLEVDGDPVGDRDTRLSDLFINQAAQAFDQAARIAEESARYNIGGVSRTINVPTLALVFLSSASRYRFDFRIEGGRKIEGIETAGIGYRERQRPTLIRTTGDNDLEASGVLFIDPDTGRVIQTVLRTDDGSLQSEITVTFRPDGRLGIWVPARMKELYKGSSERIEGTATYAKFRRFKVETFEIIK